MEFWRRVLALIGLVARQPREGDALPVAEAHTDEAEAREIASSAAAASGDYPWRSPITTQLLCHEGRARWFVRCNAGQRGSSMLVVIDDETGNVVRTQTQPR